MLASHLPGDYQRMLTIAQVAGGPVMVEEVGVELGDRGRGARPA
ncbi:hypothetical protein [Streptomyces sp. x-80]